MPTSTRATEAIAQIEADRSRVLGMRIGSKDVQLDQYIPASDAQLPPQLSPQLTTTPSLLSPTKTYLAISLDLDAPYPFLKFLSPVLHWIQPGLRVSRDESGAAVLKADAPFVANYMSPEPPLASGRHRYVFLLYEQPDGFEARKYAPPHGRLMGVWARVRFGFDEWAREVGLGE
ncbi:protease inhibitor Tfs1, partial [Aspergillus sp. HF37]